MSSRRKSLPSTKRFRGFECLESRQMMAANLTASLTNGTLFINEGQFSVGQNQGVQVVELPDHRVRVTGLAPPGGGSTLINNQDFVEFAHPTDIVIGTGAGDDVVALMGTKVRNIQILAEGSSLSVRDSDTVSLVNVNASGVTDIRTGPLIDRVFIQNSNFGDNVGNDDLKISTGVPTATGQSDMDTVNLKGVTTHSATIITTGASTDIVDIEDSTLGNDSSDFLTIQTGAGADSVAIAPPAGQSGNYQSVGGNVVIQTFDSETEQDDDKVRMQQLNFHSALVRLGAGNDTVEMLGVTSVSGIGTNSTIQLEGMAGDDRFTLTDVELLDNFFALMGDGSDTLDMTYVKANKSMLLDGGAGVGTDHLEKHQMPFIPSLTVKNWEFINGIPQLAKLPLGGVLTAKLV